MIMRISDEQNSKLIKSEGGVVGILDRLKSLLKWVISGPIIASVITKVNLDITNAKVIIKTINHLSKRSRKRLLTWFKNF